MREIDRLRLLVHILCELKDSHGVTADKLREAGQDVRRQISPANRLQVLDEIYFVRQMEERYEDGEIGQSVYTRLFSTPTEQTLDANTLLQVTQTHLPNAIHPGDELSTRVHAAPRTIFDNENDVQDLGNDHSPSQDDVDSLPLSAPRGVPLSPTTSESSGPHSPTVGFGAYPVGMAPHQMHQESTSASKSMIADPNCLSGYYAQPFIPADKSHGYWPNMPHPVSHYGY